MSRLVDDVKSGLKGIRGAGDAVRGSVLEATDQAFEKNPNDPESVAHRQRDRAITEKGKADIRGADETIARHEWEHKASAEGHGVNQASTTVPSTTQQPAGQHGAPPPKGMMSSQIRNGPVLPRQS